MRLKHIPGSEEAVASSPFVIREPELCPGRWHEIFGLGEGRPLYLEAGMGKGQFITELAKRHPEINFLGLEVYPSVMIKALKKQEELQLPNLRFICRNADQVKQFFAPGEIDRLYLNFSDPWPKDRHAKRRLTSPQFLALWRSVLSPAGQLEFKTDNQDLFSFSLDSVQSCGWTLIASTRDLHGDALLSQGNVMTEYEEKFSGRGNPICKLIARP